MKIELTSTSMMTPIGRVGRQVHQPRRLSGLLEIPEIAAHSPMLFRQACSTSPSGCRLSSCTDAQCMHISVDELAIAVYGFRFDGDHTWYHIWHRGLQRLLWIQHESSMSYTSYAFLIMHALASLGPNWDGRIYDTPDCKHSANWSGSNGQCKMVVSDAAADPSGDLWFLILIEQEQSRTGNHTVWQDLSSGWIRTN